MITMMTTKDDDKGDEQKAQKIKEQVKSSRIKKNSRLKKKVYNQDSRFKISRIKIRFKTQDSRFKNEEKTQTR